VNVIVPKSDEDFRKVTETNKESQEQKYTQKEIRTCGFSKIVSRSGDRDGETIGRSR